MSKAEELAKKLGKEIVRTVAHDVLMQDTLTHLRAIDASHQRLQAEGEAMANYIDTLGGDSKKYRAAIEQAKDLS